MFLVTSHTSQDFGPRFIGASFDECAAFITSCLEQETWGDYWSPQAEALRSAGLDAFRCKTPVPRGVGPEFRAVASFHYEVPEAADGGYGSAWSSCWPFYTIWASV